MQAGSQITVLLNRQADVEESVHRRQETVDPVFFAGKTELGHAAHDLFFEFVLGLHFGLDEQVAVLLQQRRQFIAAEAATVEHGDRIAALIGQVLDEDEGEQRQTLRSFVHRSGGEVRYEVVETTGVTDQLKAQGLEQRAVLVLEVRQLCVQLRIAAADVITLEQLAKDRRQLGQFG
ncbi:hypothetical protein D3C81_1089970 [compost metagenome]